MKVSKLPVNLIGSEIIKIGNEINNLTAKGKNISSFTIGDLNFSIYPIPELLKEEIKKAYQNNLTNYSPANGLLSFLSLRQEVSKDLKKRWNLEYSPNDILITARSRPLLYRI